LRDSDLNMPGLNGLELQDRLLADGCRLRPIFITAFPKESARKRALDAGAVAFLTKPFEEASLIRAFENRYSRFGSAIVSSPVWFVGLNAAPPAATPPTRRREA
jgi:CheY-like chemotaxis protein